jgi:methanethiol S-methyltransferase
MSRAAHLAFSVAAYATFGVALVWAVVFLTGAGRPPLVDTGRSAPPLVAIAVDLGLLGLFAVQHSVMARAGFKRALTRVIPRAAERSLFVLLASLVLLLLFVLWLPLPAVVWSVGGAPAVAVAGIAWAGWAALVASTFMIDHFDLFGVRQGWRRFRGQGYSGPPFQTRWFYRWVRHPLMTSFLVIFWAVPRMTAGHLLFAAAASGYILVGIRLEERDLVRAVPEYAGYRERVGGLVPKLRQPQSGVDLARRGGAVQREEVQPGRIGGEQV